MSAAAIDSITARISEIQSKFSPASSSPTTLGASFSDTLTNVLGESAGTSGLAADLGLDTLGGSNATGQDAVDVAKKWLGVPYVWGGTDPDKGLDCSGLVQSAYKELGISLPRVASEQARQGTAVSSLAQAKPGDLLAFGSPVDHIGIYVGDNKMIVAPKRGDVVKIQDVYTTPTAIRRIVPEDGVGSAASSVSSNLSSRFNDLFAQAGAKYDISPNLLAAVAKQESGFNPNAVSGAGAQGLMQIMPGTARGLGVNAMDPTQAVDGAARMLSGLVKQFKSTELALAAYNAGPGAVQKYGGIPPYNETQNYVKKVMSLAQQGVGT
jgi:peptidoglycan DL-endopeptidase CwlO